MQSSAKRGNNPELWCKLLSILDERLQLGLLEHLRRAASYHFESNTLFIKAENQADHEYLSKTAVLQQLQILASDVLPVEKIVIEE
jgi:hypothetical protein